MEGGGGESAITCCALKYDALTSTETEREKASESERERERERESWGGGRAHYTQSSDLSGKPGLALSLKSHKTVGKSEERRSRLNPPKTNSLRK